MDHSERRADAKRHIGYLEKVPEVTWAVDTESGVPRLAPTKRTRTWDTIGYFGAKNSVEVFHRAGAGASRVTTRTAGSRGHCRLGGSAALRRYCKNGQLRLQLFTLAFRALGFLLAKNQGLEFMATARANIFKNRHIKDSASWRPRNSRLLFKIKSWTIRKPQTTVPH